MGQTFEGPIEDGAHHVSRIERGLRILKDHPRTPQQVARPTLRRPVESGAIERHRPIVKAFKASDGSESVQAEPRVQLSLQQLEPSSLLQPRCPGP
jgi:hypothetical protein